MVENLLQRIRGRIVGEILVWISMMRFSEKNKGLSMVAIVSVRRCRRMNTSAKHREQDQELENYASHSVRLAEQYGHSKHLTCPARLTEPAEAPPGSAWAGKR